jgi:hypothetical protein
VAGHCWLSGCGNRWVNGKIEGDVRTVPVEPVRTVVCSTAE